VTGGPDTARPEAGGSEAAEPLHRALFRESALAHYERWGGDPASGGRQLDGVLPSRWWKTVVAASVVCLTALVAVAVLVRVAVFTPVPALVLTGDGPWPGRVVAVLPESAAGRVRGGTTVRVPAADGAGTVRVVVSGSGQVLTATQLVREFPTLAGAAALPARGVLAAGGDGPSAPARGGSAAGGGPVVVMARGYVGDRRLISLLGSGGP